MNLQILSPGEGRLAKKSRKDFPPVIVRPFSAEHFAFLREQTALARKAHEGKPYSDTAFNRHYIHNPQFLIWMHDMLIPLACETFREKVKPSYVFLSLYGDSGVCPKHVDRPQCKYTIDLCIAQKEPWDIFVEGTPYTLQEGEALCLSGTDQEHWREPIRPGNFCDLAFFHFVPARFRGDLA